MGVNCMVKAGKTKWHFSYALLLKSDPLLIFGIVLKLDSKCINHYNNSL